MRSPPSPPADLDQDATPRQQAIYWARWRHWHVGERLRAWLATQTVDPYTLPDDLPLAITARYSSTPGGSSYVSDGMGPLIRLLDAQAKTHSPVARAYGQLCDETPAQARVVYAAHVLLLTCGEIAQRDGQSPRTVARLLALGNLRMEGLLDSYSDYQTQRRAGRRALRQAEQIAAGLDDDRSPIDGWLDDDPNDV